MKPVQYGHLEMALETVKRLAGTPIANHLLRMDLLKSKKSLVGALDEWLEVKAQLVTEYGEAKPEGVMIDPKADYFAEFQDKYDALLQEVFGGSLIEMPDRLLQVLELSVDDMELFEHIGLISLVEETPPIAVVN